MNRVRRAAYALKGSIIKLLQVHERGIVAVVIQAIKIIASKNQIVFTQVAASL
jgi:hypothetical protein